MSGYLMRGRQVGMKVEAVQGTKETLGAADYSGNFLADSVQHGFTVPDYERNRLTGRMIKTGVLKSPLRMMKPAFTMEAAGGTATVGALWHAALRGAGFRRGVAYKQTYDTLAADPPKPGDIIADNATLGSVTKIHMVGYVLDNGDGTGTFWYTPIYSTHNAAFGTAATVHNLTATANGFTTSAVASAQKGFGFVLTEDVPDGVGGVTPTESVTWEERSGGEIFTSVGSKWPVKLSLAHGKPLMIEVNGGMGLPFGELDGDGKFRFIAGDIVSGVTLPAAPPRLMAAQAVTIDDLPLDITTMEFEVANTLADNATIGLGDSASVPDSGYSVCSITDRSVNWTADPLKVPKASLDGYSKIAEGDSVSVYAAVGQLTGPSAANGVVVVVAPKVQLKGDLTDTDRNGKIAMNMQGVALGNDLSTDIPELFVFHIFT